MRGLTNPNIQLVLNMPSASQPIGMSVNQFANNKKHLSISLWNGLKGLRVMFEGRHRKFDTKVDAFLPRNRMPRRVYRQGGTDQIVTFDRVTSPSAKTVAVTLQINRQWRMTREVLCSTTLVYFCQWILRIRSGWPFIPTFNYVQHRFW